MAIDIDLFSNAVQNAQKDRVEQRNSAEVRARKRTWH
jgi:hypothetical protein